MEREWTKHGALLLVVAGYVALMTSLLVLPYALHERHYLPSWKDSLVKTYGGMNTPKTVVLGLVTTLFFAFGAVVVRKSVVTVPRFISVFFLLAFVSGFTIYYAPQHAAFDLVSASYTQPAFRLPTTRINFLALGDTQEFGSNGQRHLANALAVESINRFVDETYPNSDMFDGDIQGLLVPGDCTQSGEDGRYFTRNWLGDYELKYGLGSADSDLKVSVYECTGNHDWDTVAFTWPLHFAYPWTPTVVTMIERKNKRRSNITATDGLGNYEWEWHTVDGTAKLVVIAVNVWPAAEDRPIFSGTPRGSKAFLVDRIAALAPTQRFVILTHTAPKKWTHDLGPGYPSGSTFIDTDVGYLIEVLGSKKANLLAFVLGHVHLSTTSDQTNNDGIRFIIGPAPANGRGYKGNFTFLSYDTSTHMLTVQEINNGVTSVNTEITDEDTLADIGISTRQEEEDE